MKTTAECLVLALLLAAPAYAKSSTAERLETVIRVQPGGTLHVTETLVMRFDSGSFDELTRHLTGRGNDGVEVLEISMDGRRIAIGDGPGQARIDGKLRNRIRWRFPPTAASTHSFGVRYLVVGAVRQDSRGDVLVWRAPVGEHRWGIKSTTIDYQLPDGIVVNSSIKARRTRSATVNVAAAGPRLVASDIRANGWAEATLIMPAGSILTTAPAWQRAERQRAASSPAWLGAAGILLVAGLVPLFALRQGYSTPPPGASPSQSTAPPHGALAPALVGALVSKGQPSLEHAAASLFALADRGVVQVKEDHRGAFGTRTYVLSRAVSHQSLAPHEHAVLETVFTPGSAPVTLSKARARLTRRIKTFSRAVTAELDANGLIDHDRQATRRAYVKLSGWLFALAAATVVVWPLTMDRAGAWPLVIPAAFICAALLSVILYTVSTPLSNDGIRQAGDWSSYKTHLKSVAAGSDDFASSAAPLAYVVALGLATEWSKYLEARSVRAPDWFQSEEGTPAYSAFVAAAGAGPAHAAH